MDSIWVKLGLKQPVPKMFTRLRNLTRYFEACEITDPRITIIENTLKSVDGIVHFKFYSKQGPVEVVLSKNRIFGVSYTLKYTSYAGIKLFTVKADDENVTVDPCMGYSYNVDAKDIDLAILELEQYLQDNYGNIDDRWEQYQLEEKLAWESHKEQLKELY